MRFTIVLLFTLFSSVFGKGFGPGEQDYGYVTVRDGAHMFWWLYHTTADVPVSTDRPLILWLAGGPGGSGTGIGNFMVAGPIDEYLEPREYTWVKENNILFVDNPVGVGYSFVEQLHFLTTNNTQIAKDLVEAMKGFYRAMPEFTKTPLFVYGISYGGKMGTEFAYYFNKEVEMGNIDVKLNGIGLGNAWISPVDSVLTWAPFLYEMSLVDEKGRDMIDEQAKYVKEKLDTNHLVQATLEFFRTQSTVFEATEDVDFYNIIVKPQKVPTRKSVQEEYLKRTTFLKNDVRDGPELIELMYGPVKEALGIPEYVTWGMQVPYIFDYLYSDFMTPVTDIIEYLLNNTDIQIHVCNGNLDLIVDTPGQFAWMNRLNWKNKEQFKNAPRTTIWVNDTMEGYQKNGGGLWYHGLNVAGHSAPIENVVGTRYFLKTMTGY